METQSNSVQDSWVEERHQLLSLAIYPRRILDGIWLKVIGFAFTLIDHIGLIFGPEVLGEVCYQILRCTGRCAFPIFVFLAIEGVYHTRNYWRYFGRLALMAIILDAFCYVVYYAFPETGGMLTPGNVFTDLALGSLVIYLFRRNDKWTLLALLPIAYLVLSDFTVYRQGADGVYALIPAGVASDYGTYGLVMFIAMYFGYEGGFRYLRWRASQAGLQPLDVAPRRMRLILNGGATIGLLAVGCLFQLIRMLFGFTPIEPGISWAWESYSMLGAIFIMLYDGRPGTRKKAIRYPLYLFYPLHLIVLYLISLAF